MKIEFEKQFGKGTDPWYAQAERWAKKQRFPISFLLLGIIDYLKKWWIDVKIYNTMKDVDRQTDELLHSWKEPERRPNIVDCLLYTSPSPRDGLLSRMPSSA